MAFPDASDALTGVAADQPTYSVLKLPAEGVEMLSVMRVDSDVLIVAYPGAAGPTEQSEEASVGIASAGRPHGLDGRLRIEDTRREQKS